MRFKLLVFALLVSGLGWGQVAAWDFTGENTVATSSAEVFSGNLDSSSLLTRGAGATANAGANSFRTQGFQNNGISIANIDYFQIELSAAPGFALSLSTIDAHFAGTASFAATPGVTQQFAYSLDGSNFDLILSSQITIGTPATLSQINLSGIPALQNVSEGTTITLRYYASGQTNTGGWGFYSPSAGTYGLAIGGTLTPAGITTAQDGDWYTGSTWVGGVVPTDAENAVLNHQITSNLAITRNLGTQTTVNTGASLAMSNATYTNNGTTTVNGIFELQSGSYAQGNNFIYSATTGTLNFNVGSSYGVANDHVYWPIANGPFNVNVLNGDFTLNTANRTINGTLNVSNGGVTFNTSSLTLNGTCLINSGGFFANSPIFGAASTLIYNSGGTYNRGNEWQANGVGTIGTTPGYPNNVQLSSSTTLNYTNGTPLAKAIHGNLTIDAGSNFYMDYGGGASGGTLTIAGNISNAGSFTLGNAIGDDLRLGGNFTQTGAGTFNGNGRAIFFTKNGTQTVSSVTALTIPYVVFAPTTGSATVQLLSNLAISAPATGNAISFSSATDVLDINGQTLSIGTNGVANTISGLGTFRGTTTSQLTLVGTGNIGILRFTAGQQVLGNLTLNRQSSVVGFELGTTLTINGVLSLTNGIVDLAANQMIVTLTGTISNASAGNYIIADKTVGGSLRKNLNASGSFTFPIGDSTTSADGSQYSPVTLEILAGTVGGYAIVNVEDLKEPNNDADVDYITRYWSLTGTGITNATYNFTGTYLNEDKVGTEANYKSGRYNLSNSTWKEGSTVTANTVTMTGLTTTTDGAFTNEYHYTAGNPFKKAEITIKQGATTYLHTSTFDFGNVAVGTTNDIVFTIENTGLESLSLGGATMSGATYVLFANYSTPVIGGGSTTFTIRFTPTSIATFTGSISIPSNDNSGSENPYVINFSGNGIGSSASDIVAVASSEAATISSLENTAIISTISDGIQVWSFTIRDGGSGLNDVDNLSTTLTALTITQGTSNSIANWTDAIQSIALFDGSTFVANGVINVTNIVFSGLSVEALDNNSKTLTMRLSLKCPLGPTALDGNDFDFSITPANSTFLPTGSGKNTGAAVASTPDNAVNFISVVATTLQFVQQPVSTVLGYSMPSVTVHAVDSCGNTDRNFTGLVSLTSTGTMTGTTLNVNAVSGVATFTSNTHIAIGSNLLLNATSIGLSSTTSSFFMISIATVLEPGDVAILALNAGYTDQFVDEISFVTFVDITPGTRIDITDNAFQKCGTPNGWGISEGWIRFERLNSTLPKGSVITIRVDAGTPTVFSPDTSNWNASKPQPSSQGVFNLGLLGEQIFFMTGGNVGGPNNTTPDTDDGTYSGYFLFGFNTLGNVWTPFCANVAGGGTSNSDKPINFDCFLTWPTSQSDKNKYIGSLSTATKSEWIARINNSANWTGYINNTAYTNGPNYYDVVLPIIDGDYFEGVWTGTKNTNWFDCANWQALRVPNETIDVVFGSEATQEAVIDAAASSASAFGGIAKSRNLSITNQKVTIEGTDANKLEIHGDLLIDSSGFLDMNDGNPATADGQLYLYGNWTNAIDIDAFDHGNGTVHFTGSGLQVINNVVPLGTEQFYNVILNNNFNTGESNDLVAEGDLTINLGKTVTIDSAGYVVAHKKLTHNGTLLIENDGQFIQGEVLDTNDGLYTGSLFQVKRDALVNKFDYVYWSSPTENYNISGIVGSPKYYWNPIAINANGTQGNWIAASGIMLKSRGYIVRVPSTTPERPLPPVSLTTTFSGKPYNGDILYEIKRGSNSSSYNDNFNLIGNPYPSAIDADLFINENTNIEGSLMIWTHGTAPSPSFVNPFYQNFTNNYTAADYITYNGTAVTIPDAFDGKIASGQGFFIKMEEDGLDTQNVLFKNSWRRNSSNALPFENSQFYKTTTNFETTTSTVSRHRIWIDLISSAGNVSKTVVGYVNGATLAKDRVFDAYASNDPTLQNFYSLIGTEKIHIQGRPLPFVSEDQVPLGFTVVQNGTYTLAILTVDGLFSNGGQTIYLEDTLLNQIHNLSAAPYVFTSTVGTFDTRFILRYTNETLSSPQIIITNQLFVSVSDGINVQSQQELIEQVVVYDLLGKRLYEGKGNQLLTHKITQIQLSRQVLFVQVTLANGAVVTKKVVY